MLTILTFNIGDYSNSSIIDLANFLNTVEADIIGLHEVAWAQHEGAVDSLKSTLGFGYSAISLSHRNQNHSVLLSRFPLLATSPLDNLTNSGIISTVDSPIGPLSIASVHLAPSSEELRLNEVWSIIPLLQTADPTIIMGDLNAISTDDPVVHKGRLSEPVKHLVTNAILAAGFIDTGQTHETPSVPTVPVTQDGDVTYFDLRLDYIYIKNLQKQQNFTYGTLHSAVSDHSLVYLNVY